MKLVSFQNASSLLLPSDDFASTANLPTQPWKTLQTFQEQGAFPGASYAVLHRGHVVDRGAVGRFTFDPTSPVITPETSFDLASVSKVLATTAIAMLLCQRGVLSLDMPVEALLPGFAGPNAIRARVTLRMLLSHSSGLPGYAPLFETVHDADELLARALDMPLNYAPGERSEYSDIGFILLGRALEVLAGEPLDTFCAREIFAPLGMAATRYCPPMAERGAIPPTEDDKSFRHSVIQGVVHDENCYVLGGVSGHAGLFAPAMDVLRFSGEMLSPAGLLDEKTIRLFTKQTEVSGSSRALGWDTPSRETSSSGHFFNKGSFGHLGYTGTSLWIDPVRECAVVLLTNRTFPTRENKLISQVRPQFHDAVVKSLQH